jgi:hypothetical protein
MKLVKFFLSFILLLIFQIATFAQDPLGSRDLSTVKVEALTDNQISAIQQKLKQSGMTIDQVESQAIAKGMSPTEFAKLKERVNNPISFAKKASIPGPWSPIELSMPLGVSAILGVARPARGFVMIDYFGP